MSQPAAASSDSSLSSEADLLHKLSEYEIQRRRTMERNHRKLEELGLVQRKKAEIAGSVATGIGTAIKASRTKAPTAAVAAGPARRSLRNQGKIAPVYKDDAVRFDDDRYAGHKRSRPPVAAVTTTTAAVGSTTPLATSRRIVPSKPVAADSSRNLECDIRLLMEHYLGRRFPSFGKAVVMDIATKSVPPKFSKMSGVVEWKNAVFLWVNVGEAGEGGGYTNLFEAGQTRQVGASTATVAAAVRPADGTPKNITDSDVTDCGGDGNDVTDSDDGWLCMTWFAGGRMTADSALIRRLLQVHSTSPTTVSMGNYEAMSGPKSATATAGESVAESISLAERQREDSDDVQARDTKRWRGAAATVRAVKSMTKATNAPVPAMSVDDGSDDTDNVLLFCRLSKEPYVFCGRLGYVEHWPAERPMRFAWRLLDAGRLARYPDFTGIVEVAGVTTAMHAESEAEEMG